ncbi:MAG: (2Fe-2S)-binding protein [Fulvimarina manganoxydans]|uniref:(2Fe-2S)-binding protein n=1 Tax=Fulvimarina manganoxydans TaxID=937218 RepID=UPI002356999A|nr:(2Fe-2S)-binding protein [Fulvimarina manganoxydans]MCK5934522.1 (2Fe-2S)-binding protein [Fulvimarina manganoxydans]MEE2951201.1 (2Fe-2S)-binding protein [Pseudomonadota bacterium]
MPKLRSETTHEIGFTLNGRRTRARVEARMLLTDLIRHAVGATGTHVGCEHGVCGACTVQIDGEPVRACLTLAAQAEGVDIRTVEGLEPRPGQLSPLQAAFREHFALQCGFCTAGILMSLDALFARKPEASEREIREQLSGHLCRCTGYAPIVRAALAAQAHVREEKTTNA